MKEIRINFNFSTLMISNIFRKATKLGLVLNERAKKVKLFDNLEKSISVNKDTIINIWNNLLIIDYTKVLQKDENMMELDGYNLVTHLQSHLKMESKQY